MRGWVCSPIGGKAPRVADAFEPLLFERFGFLSHCLDAADESPVSNLSPLEPLPWRS